MAVKFLECNCKDDFNNPATIDAGVKLCKLVPKNKNAKEFVYQCMVCGKKHKQNSKHIKRKHSFEKVPKQFQRPKK